MLKVKVTAKVKVEKKIGYLQGQGHSEDSYINNDCFYHIYRSADPFGTSLN